MYARSHVPLFLPGILKESGYIFKGRLLPEELLFSWTRIYWAIHLHVNGGRCCFSQPIVSLRSVSYKKAKRISVFRARQLRLPTLPCPQLSCPFQMLIKKVFFVLPFIPISPWFRGFKPPSLLVVQPYKKMVCVFSKSQYSKGKMFTIRMTK